MNAVVSIRRLTYSYPVTTVTALDDLSVELTEGEFVVVAGASGSGKSTLLRAIAGLVPHFHGGEISGTVRVAGLDTQDHGPGQLAAAVGTLAQDPETQIVLGTVRAELAFPVENRGWGAAAVALAVEETALALAIDHLLDRSTAELSGGELQRVALAATLTPRPPIVCLDEPTSQLDPVAGDELISLLRRINEDSDVTVILSEHRLERCLPYADRVLALDGGRLAFDGTPDRFLEWSLTHAPSLATPGANLLAQLNLAPVPGVKAARRVLRQAGFGLNAQAHAFDRTSHGHAARSDQKDKPAQLRFKGVWHELKDGPAILRAVSLEVRAGERIALMGRNGAGKSTLLRHAAGLMEPTRGKVHASGRVALVLQNPTDYLVHDLVSEEAPAAALARFGLSGLAARHPRDLSGGEKQRLALAIVLGSPQTTAEAAVVCLDEPTRGMDRTVKLELVELLQGLDAAVVVATHDPEFAATFADRVVLVADGRVIADGQPRDVLATGAYFTTETARIVHGALLPADAAGALTAAATPWTDHTEHREQSPTASGAA